MAQHLEISDKYKCEDKDEQKTIRELVKDVRADIRALRETDDLVAFESVYKDLPREFNEPGDTSVSIKYVDVPESMVWGGKASLEIHFKGSRIRKVYLVA